MAFTSIATLGPALGLPSAYSGDQTVAWDRVNNTLTLAQGTITTSQPQLQLTSTWNAGGVAFTGFKMNVTDTAHGAGSRLIDLQTGGTSRFFVTPDGRVIIVGASSGINWGTEDGPDLISKQGSGFYWQENNSRFLDFVATTKCLLGRADTPTTLRTLAAGSSLGQAALGFGALYLDYTNTGTVGAVTINKPSGRVNIAAAGTSVVVTNSLVTAASHVFAVASQNDTTARVTNVVTAAGSFTINTVATTAQTSFDFLVINAD